MKLLSKYSVKVKVLAASKGDKVDATTDKRQRTAVTISRRHSGQFCMYQPRLCESAHSCRGPLAHLLAHCMQCCVLTSGSFGSSLGCGTRIVPSSARLTFGPCGTSLRPSRSARVAVPMNGIRRSQSVCCRAHTNGEPLSSTGTTHLAHASAADSPAHPAPSRKVTERETTISAVANTKERLHKMCREGGDGGESE